MDFRHVSQARFFHTIGWAILLACLIIAIAASLGRAAMNLHAALTDKPDIALYLLLPDEGIRSSTLLRDKGAERDYLVETKDGPKLIRLKRGEDKWFVSFTEKLRE